ncbi:MAG: hypothetical protein IJF24_04590 [Clostridia bacterium]|nr:hypothetical protein [Clostridia bacterium]
MKQPLSPRAFLVRLLVCTLAVLLVTGSVMVFVDPFFHYRAPSADYVLNDRFCMRGIIRHNDYDAALVGSSMCQNFDMDQLDALTGGEVLKATKGGMTLDESTEICRWLAAAGKADTVYLGIDLTRFNEGEIWEYYPTYLANDTVLDDWRYLYGYEAWMRYLPLDVFSLSCDALGTELPDAIRSETDIDAIGRWSERAESQNAFVGEETLVANYLEGKGSVAKQDTENMAARMKARLDRFLEGDPFDPDTTYYVFFSPYSVLFWAHYERQGAAEELFEFRTYFFDRLSEYDNVIPLDFQAMDEIEDLSLYKDISHYHESVNDKMAEGFSSGEFVTDKLRAAENNEKIRAATARLLDRYPALQAPLN